MQLHPLQAEGHFPGFLCQFLRQIQCSLAGFPSLLQQQMHFIAFQSDFIPLQLIGEKIAALRKAKNITQTQLAEYLFLVQEREAQ